MSFLQEIQKLKDDHTKKFYEDMNELLRTSVKENPLSSSHLIPCATDEIMRKLTEHFTNLGFTVRTHKDCATWRSGAGIFVTIPDTIQNADCSPGESRYNGHCC